MKRVSAFAALALAAFMAPYLVTEREVFFPSLASVKGPVRSDLDASAEVVRGFLAALSSAYAEGRSRALLPFVASPEALEPLERDLRFLASRGRRIELALESVEARPEVGPDRRIRVRTKERWSVAEGGAGREAACTAVFLMEPGPSGPRVEAWEVFP